MVQAKFHALSWVRQNYVSISDPVTVVKEMEYFVWSIWIICPIPIVGVLVIFEPQKIRPGGWRESQVETMQRKILRSSQDQSIKKYLYKVHKLLSMRSCSLCFFFFISDLVINNSDIIPIISNNRQFCSIPEDRNKVRVPMLSSTWTEKHREGI